MNSIKHSAWHEAAHSRFVVSTSCAGSTKYVVSPISVHTDFSFDTGIMLFKIIQPQGPSHDSAWVGPAWLSCQNAPSTLIQWTQKVIHKYSSQQY
eukprot:c21793_g1_i2 orf=371-655(-)